MVIETKLATAAGIGIPAPGLGQGAPAAARPEDVARFEAALTAPPAETGPATAQAAVVGELQPAPPTQMAALTAPTSLGEAILDGISRVRDTFDGTVTSIRHLLDTTTSEMTIRDMLSIQMQIATLTIQQDLMGKIVGKATQNVDQLLKAQ